MIGEADILAFARDLGWTPGGKALDLFDDCGIAGDNGDEFLMAFAERFGVDMTNFLWYFHYNANEPPYIETIVPHSPDGQRLERIPLTPSLLAEAANKGHWPVTYPEHIARGAITTWIPFVVLIVFVVLILKALLFS